MYKILVVDDEELERKVIAFTLQNSGLPVEIVGEAGNGRDAVEIAKRVNTDLVLMDIKMPGIDGIEATKLIKQVNPATEIIILTAYGKFSFSQQAIRAQASDYLLKPTHPQQLIEAVQKALNRLENKRYQPGPALDMTRYKEQIRLGNLQEARNALAELLVLFNHRNTQPAVSRVNSFGFKLLVFAVQALLESGVDSERLADCEELLAGELGKVSSYLDLMEWANRMLENLFTLRIGANTGHDQNLVLKAMDYVEANFAADLSLSQVAAQVHLSPAYLSRIFAKKTGCSFTEYLTKVRLKEAQHRLRNSTDTIDQIATSVGFCSSSYFTSVFKKHEGITPSEFRITINRRNT